MTSESQPVPLGPPPIPDSLPVLPVRNTVVFPMAVVPLMVGQPRSIKLIDDVMRSKDRMMALVAHEKEAPAQPSVDELPKIGTAVVILQLARGSDGTVGLMIQGVERIRILEHTSTDPYLVAKVERAPAIESSGVQAEGLARAVADLFKDLVKLSEEMPDEMAVAVDQMTDPHQVANFVAGAAPVPTAVRQALLEMNTVDAKLNRLVEILQHELAVRMVRQKITTETQKEMSKAQRDYVLREQLKAIRKELGEEEGGQPEIEQLRKKISEAKLPQEARREADRELARLASIPSASPEHGIVQTYLDWVANLPWGKKTGGGIDIKFARSVLDEDHYDLEKIKDRILEYLAVKKLRQDRREPAAPPADGMQPDSPLAITQANEIAREPILCFLGPPGVGKTSLGHSIARALNRKFVRVSLGGVHDEAEIRGHRRTYIGAMPGRILQSLRRAEAMDPVFVLDEIDKVAADWRGDPSSALLEVLDPAQNHSFVDNYLGVAFDLSQVLFIATANTLDTIPPALRDRMEVLQLSGYTDEEKASIAEKYLVPKQLKAHALTEAELKFERDAIRAITRGYTREAGVRNLDREIANICRKVARDIAEGGHASVVVDLAAVVKYLSRPRFHDDVSERTERPGVATGMAWTPVGGDILFVEVALMPSHEEKLIITGMLGDVMRESAQAALSYIRSNSHTIGVSPDVFEKKAVHVHVPAGAIPKDGPSAGVTIATAIGSLVTGRRVRSDIAMTGEITLRGKVLPVGGIKEKVLAAHRAGIKTIILPKRNERDLDDIPAELRNELRFILADTVNEVLDHALEPATARQVVAAAS